MKTTLVVPILNELEGMKKIMPLIKPEWCDQILIIDGGSKDGSVEWARERGYEVYVQKKRGMRHAYTEALEFIRGDVIVTFSPDGNSLPEAIPAMIEKMKEGYDMVIASRYADGATSTDDDAVTGFGNWLFTRTVNVLFDARYTDAMVILRAYRKQIVYDLRLHLDEPYELVEKLFGTKVSWEPLLSARAAKYKLKVCEVGFDEPPRLAGERKLEVLRWGAAYYSQFLLEFLIKNRK